MNCDQAREYFSAYVEGELSGARLVEFKQHVGSCRSCAEDTDSLPHMLKSLGVITQHEPPEWLHGRIMARLTQIHDARETVKEMSLWDIILGRTQRWARVAAVVILLALIAMTPYVPVGRAVLAPILPDFQKEMAANPQDSITLRVSPTPVEGSTSTLILDIRPDRDLPDAWVRLWMNSGIEYTRRETVLLSGQFSMTKGKETTLCRPLELNEAGMRTMILEVTGDNGRYRAEKVAFMPIRNREMAHQPVGSVKIYLEAKDMNVYDALAFLAAKTKTPIIMDTDLHGTVNVSIDGEKLGSALEKVLAPLGYTWNASAGVYVVRTEPIND